MKVNIQHCARCEENHNQLEFSEFFLHPVCDEQNNLCWKYWAMCPVQQEPILLRIFDSDKHSDK